LRRRWPTGFSPGGLRDRFCALAGGSARAGRGALRRRSARGWSAPGRVYHDQTAPRDGLRSSMAAAEARTRMTGGSRAVVPRCGLRRPSLRQEERSGPLGHGPLSALGVGAPWRRDPRLVLLLAIMRPFPMKPAAPLRHRPLDPGPPRRRLSTSTSAASARSTPGGGGCVSIRPPACCRFLGASPSFRRHVRRRFESSAGQPPALAGGVGRGNVMRLTFDAGVGA